MRDAWGAIGSARKQQPFAHPSSFGPIESARARFTLMQALGRTLSRESHKGCKGQGVQAVAGALSERVPGGKKVWGDPGFQACHPPQSLTPRS